MAYSTFSNVRLAALSAVIPTREVVLEDEAGYYGANLEKLRLTSRVSGLEKRRVAPDGMTASDLCAAAATRLFAALDIDPASVDALFFVSQTPDYQLPATAAILHSRLGLAPGGTVMDMNVGCAGFPQGLLLAAGLVEAGACRRALVLVGDTIARFLDPANRVTAPVFGDAGTAALLEHEPGSPGMSFLPGADGSGFESLIIPGGGSRIPNRADEGPDSPFNRTVQDAEGNPWTLGGYGRMRMNGMAVFTFGVTRIPQHIKRHLGLAGLAAGDLDRLFLNQTNRLMLETIARKSGVAEEKTPWSTLPRYGNQGAASLPVVICDQLGQGSGPRNRVLICGFGAGLAWTSCLLSLEHTRILPVAELPDDGTRPTRDEQIASWHARFKT